MVIFDALSFKQLECIQIHLCVSALCIRRKVMVDSEPVRDAYTKVIIIICTWANEIAQHDLHTQVCRAKSAK